MGIEVNDREEASKKDHPLPRWNAFATIGSGLFIKPRMSRFEVLGVGQDAR